MHHAIDWVLYSSVATLSALTFYIFMLLLIFVPFIRKYFGQILSLPMPSTNVQIASLDTIRGAAAAIVAMAHMWNFCTPFFNKTQTMWFWFLAVGGNKAVPIFVVLSGFLIVRTVKRIKTVDDLSLYVQRRFLRIYPVYLFTVLLGFVLRQLPFNFADLLSNIFMIRSINPVYLTFVNPPAWSLYVEVLFYIVLPIWVVVFRNRLMIGAIASFLVLLFVDPLASRELWLWKYFFIGIFTSELVEYLKNHISEWQAIALFIVGLVMLRLDFKIGQNNSAPFDWFNLLGIVPKNQDEYTVGLGIACMLILIGMYHSRKVAQIMSIKPLRVLGIISYSLYLIHPFFILAVFPKLQFKLAGTVQHFIDPVVYAPAWYLPFVMFPGCLAWAIACFIVVERPFLLLRPQSRCSENVTELSLSPGRLRSSA